MLFIGTDGAEVAAMAFSAAPIGFVLYGADKYTIVDSQGVMHTIGITQITDVAALADR